MVASSARNKAVAADVALIGELGLSGELRSVSQLSRRLHEAQKLGFQLAVIPNTLSQSSGADDLPEGIQVVRARRLSEAIDAALLA